MDNSITFTRLYHNVTLTEFDSLDLSDSNPEDNNKQQRKEDGVYLKWRIGVPLFHYRRKIVHYPKWPECGGDPAELVPQGINEEVNSAMFFSQAFLCQTYEGQTACLV